MTRKQAIELISAIIDRYILEGDKAAVEALQMARSYLISEQIECEAGAEQKAWNERRRTHFCEDCKYEHKGLFDEPCVRCDAETLDLWEEKENETSQ